MPKIILPIFFLLFSTLAWATPELQIPFKGDLSDSSVNLSGDVYMKFALYETSGNNTVWSNDGSGVGSAPAEPTAAVTVSLSDGQFTVWLGDTSATNMTVLSKTTFDTGSLYLRIWLSDDNSTFTQLSPDKRMSAEPFAFRAHSAESSDDAAKLSGVTPGATGLALLDDGSATEAIATLGLGTASTNASGDFSPVSHGHDASEIIGLGDISTQSSNNVSVTGGSVSGVSISSSTLEVSGSTNLAGIVFPSSSGNVGQLLSVGSDGALDWVDPKVANGSNTYAFKAYMSAANQMIAGWTPSDVVNFDVTEFDTTVGALINGGNTFKPTVEGYYLLNARAEVENVSLDEYAVVRVYKNGSFHSEGSIAAPDQEMSGEPHTGTILTTLVHADGVNDYFDIRVYHTHNDDKELDGDIEETWFSGFLLSGTGGLGGSASIDGLTSLNGTLSASGNLTVTGNTTTPKLNITSGAQPSSSQLGDLSTFNANLHFYNGNQWVNLSGLSNSISKVAILKDVKPFGTAGGTTTADSEQARDLNTIEGDYSGWLTLSGNQFTLEPGNYMVEARAPGHRVGVHQIFLYDGTSYVKDGSSLYSDPSAEVTNYSFLEAHLSLSVSKTYELKHYTQTAKANNGLGPKSGVLSSPQSGEIFSVVKITKFDSALGKENNPIVSGNLVVGGSSTLAGLTYPSSDGTSGQALVTDGSGYLSFGNVGSSLATISESEGNTYLSGNLVVGGSSTLSGLTYPSADGTSGQALITDGSGNLSFGDVGSSLATISESEGNTYLSGNLVVDGSSSLSGLTYPSTDGASGQALLTDGSGNLTFGTVGNPLATISESEGKTYLNANLIVDGSANLSGILFPSANGAPGQQLTVGADGNLAWQNISAASGSNAIGFLIRRPLGAGINVPDSVETLVDYTEVEFDTTGGTLVSGNTRFQPTVSGIYLLTATATLSGMADGTSFGLLVKENGVLVQRGTRIAAGATTSVTASVTTMVETDGSGDYFEIFIINTDTDGGNEGYANGDDYHSFSGVLVSPSTFVSGGSGNIDGLTGTTEQVDVSGNLVVAGSSNLGGLVFPFTPGSADQVLVTDGLGNLSWSDVNLQNSGSSNMILSDVASVGIAGNVTGLEKLSHTEHYRRIGDSIKAYGSINTTVTGAALGQIELTLPDGLVVDNSKISGGVVVGSAQGVKSGSQSVNAAIQYFSSANELIFVMTELTGSAVWSSSANIPFAWDTSDWIRYEYEVPVMGWTSGGSGVASLDGLSSSSGNLVAAANLIVTGSSNLGGILFPNTVGSANQVLVSDGLGSLGWSDVSLGSQSASNLTYMKVNSSSTNVESGIWTTVVLDNVVEDGEGLYDNLTGAVTVNESGKYLATAHLNFQTANWTEGTAVQLGVYVNNSEVDRIYYMTTQRNGSITIGMGGSTVLDLNSGDNVSLTAWQGQGVGMVLDGNANRNYFSLTRFGGSFSGGSGNSVSIEGLTGTTEQVDVSGNLIVNGGLRLGSTNDQSEGTLRWNNGNLQVADGSSWIDLTDSRQNTNVYSAVVDNNGVSASVNNQSISFIDSVNRITTGEVRVDFINGLFTETPAIVCLPYGNFGQGVTTIESASNIGFTFGTRDHVGGAQDHTFSIIVRKVGDDYEPDLASSGGGSGSIDGLTGTTEQVDVSGNLVVAGSSNLGGLLLPTMTGSSNQVLATDGNGVLFWQDSSVSSGETNYVRVNTGNGRGSVNTSIRRFLNVSDNIGSAITYNDSAADGASFIINEGGMYHISYNDIFNGAFWLGLSINSSSLNTAIYSQPVDERLLIAAIPASHPSTSVSWSGILQAGDVIRPHVDNGLADHASTDRAYFTIVKGGSEGVTSTSVDGITSSSGNVSVSGNLTIGSAIENSELAAIGGALKLDGDDARLLLYRETGHNYLDFNEDHSLIFRSANIYDESGHTNLLTLDSGGNLTIPGSANIGGVLYGSGNQGLTLFSTAGNMTTQSFADNTWIKVTFWGVPDVDTVSAWDHSSQHYIVPESGYYDVSSAVRFGGGGVTDSYKAMVSIYVNGTLARRGVEGDNSGGGIATAPSVVALGMKLNKNDQVAIYVFHDNASNVSEDINGQTVDNYFYIAKRNADFTSPGGSIDGLTGTIEQVDVSGNLVVVGSSNLGGIVMPTTMGSANSFLMVNGDGTTTWGNISGNRVVAYAGGNGGEALTGAVTNIPFTSEFEDTHNAWNGSVFTVPESGDYMITGGMYLSSASVAQPTIYINGSGQGYIGRNSSSITNKAFSGTYFFNSGDTVSIRSDTTVTLANNSAIHRIRIQKLNSPQSVVVNSGGIDGLTLDSGGNINVSGNLTVAGSSNLGGVMIGGGDASSSNLILGGYLGVGVDQPEAEIHVASDNASWSGTSRITLQTGDPRSSTSLIHQIESNSGVGDGGFHIAVSETSAIPTLADSKVFVGEEGKVGIGTVAPSSNLHVVGDSQVSGKMGIGQGVGSDTLTVTGVTRIGDSGLLALHTAGGTNIIIQAASTAEFQFVNNSAVKLLTINQNGDARLKGTLEPITDNAVDLGSAVLRWQDVYAVNGTIQTSDKRAKKEILELEEGLGTLKKLRPVSFRWNQESEGDKKHLGFIAQEVLEILPEAVSESSNEGELMGMRYNQILPVVVKSIQEQEKVIQNQESEIESLRKEIEELKNLIHMR